MSDPNSNELFVCFKHYQETNEDDFIHSVFECHNITITNTIDKLQSLVIVLRDINSDFAANKICIEIENLKTLLK